MKKENVAIALIGFGISQVILGVITSKKREKEFKRSMDEAARGATDILRRQLWRSYDPLYNAGAYGVNAAMKMEEERKKTPVAWANYPDGRRVGINADGEEIPD